MVIRPAILQDLQQSPPMNQVRSANRR